MEPAPVSLDGMSVPEPPELRFSMLGAFEVRRGAVVLDVGPYKQRLVLATLLCRANAQVSADQLIDAVWEDSPPRTARKNLQVYVSVLRKVIGPRLDLGTYGYRLRCAPDELDVARFDEAAARGRRAAREGGVAEAAAALGDALAQWRGPFLADLPRSAFLEAEAIRLDARRLRVCEDWAEAAVRLGEYRDVLDVIDELADAHSERERLTVAKLTALYQCGRRQEALAHYERVRLALASDLGLDPSPSLQRLFRVMLAGDPIDPIAQREPKPEADRSTGPAADPPTAPAPGSATGPGTRAGAVPRSRCDAMPRDSADFTGREREVGRLVEALGPAGDGPGVALVTGPVGVGKTTLAVHVAHLTDARFPDGQLFVPLRDEQRQQRPLGTVLAGAAAAVGLDLGDAGTPESIAQWRAWLATRRLLVVLDDARDASVVRALLPGRGPSRLLVTSRYRLSGLESVLRVELGELARTEAVELTAKIAGLGTVLSEHNEVASYIAYCGRSPLAVRILAGRMRQLAGPPVRVNEDLLDQLVLGDLSLAGRYREHCDELPARDRQVLGALVSAADPPFDLTAFAKVVLEPASELDRAIESLVEANLLLRPEDEVSAHGERYDMPALAVAYARSRLVA